MGRPRKEERLEGGVKMKFKKLCALTLSAVLAATTLAGCSGNGSSADGSGDDSVTLVVMGNSSDMHLSFIRKKRETSWICKVCRAIILSRYR